MNMSTRDDVPSTKLSGTVTFRCDSAMLFTTRLGIPAVKTYLDPEPGAVSIRKSGCDAHSPEAELPAER
jgi:hypothetical protein